MSRTFDVVQIGYGPVSQALAIMLARQGRSIAVSERWTSRYPLPRAVCLDHELYRVLSANGMRAVLPEISHPGPVYQWFNADWKELLAIDWSADAISGGPEVNFVHQPTLEEAMDREVAEFDNIELFLGWEAKEVWQDADLAHVRLQNRETGEEQVISAKFLIGCDGANSLVRKTIGGKQEDRGFEADWLVVDVKLKDGTTIEKLNIPAAGQYCNPERPTTIVPAGIRDGQYFRRWEFFRLPHETNEDLETEERVWELLSPWAGPDDVELVRHKIYNFRSLLAETWRDGRLLIAGDAAHVMPPFMGQGMCAGMRDAWNLAWRLGMILDGKADNHLLDTYQVERMPHVSQIIDLSIYLGKVICIPDADEAAKRDEMFFDGTAEPPPPFPSLTDGLLRRDGQGHLLPGAGQLAPHTDVAVGDSQMPLDQYTGPGFTLITNGVAVAGHLGERQKRMLDVLEVNLIEMGGAGESQVRDLTGRVPDFMDENGWSAMLVRPDFYIFGTATSGPEINTLIDDLARDASAAGIALPDNQMQEITQ